MARILVVDDETNIRLMVKLALQHAGHEVVTAADGTEALDRFGDGAGLDLVMLDQRMPGMEGLAVLREMRSRNPNARIVMATAFGTIDLAVEAMKTGATDFLRKPFTAEILRGAVASALGGPANTPGAGVTFASTTVNGYRIEFTPDTREQIDGGFDQKFTVHSPDGSTAGCAVRLPRYVIELVKAHTDRDEIPGGDRFWEALCEEALANYLWQNAAVPESGRLTVDELTAGLRRYVDAVLAA